MGDVTEIKAAAAPVVAKVEAAVVADEGKVKAFVVKYGIALATFAAGFIAAKVF
jgi:hypothetical protein